MGERFAHERANAAGVDDLIARLRLHNAGKSAWTRFHAPNIEGAQRMAERLQRAGVPFHADDATELTVWVEVYRENDAAWCAILEGATLVETK